MINRQVPLMLSVPKRCRDKLRQMAAERNFRNPNRVASLRPSPGALAGGHRTRGADGVETFPNGDSNQNKKENCLT